jgi:hypothetical protein
MNNLSFKTLPKFQQDLKYFTEKLSVITNPVLKKECNELLKELTAHASQIDQGHDPSNNGFINPSSLHENRVRMIDIRKRLTSIVNDLQRT